MRHIRTIQGAINVIRAEDPDCAITAHRLRALVRSGAIPSKRAGRKYLVAVEDALQYFQVELGGQKDEIEQNQYRKSDCIPRNAG